MIIGSVGPSCLAGTLFGCRPPGPGEVTKIERLVPRRCLPLLTTPHNHNLSSSWPPWTPAIAIDERPASSPSLSPAGSCCRRWDLGRHVAAASMGMPPQPGPWPRRRRAPLIGGWGWGGADLWMRMRMIVDDLTGFRSLLMKTCFVLLRFLFLKRVYF